MTRRTKRTIATPLFLAFWLAALLAAAAGPARGDCPPADLNFRFDTGWDHRTSGSPIAVSGGDLNWRVVVDPSGGTVPRAATVVTASTAWLTQTNSQWISAALGGPNGVYVYQATFCLRDGFGPPALNLDLRADDWAEVFLNGTLVGQTPNPGFATMLPTNVFVTNPANFVAGQNLIEVRVHNTSAVVTGFDLTGSIQSKNGLCCPCDARPVDDTIHTGVTNSPPGPTPVGQGDDEWIVVADASGGPVPRPATVVNTYTGWVNLPGAQWVSANQYGPNGLYVYEKCWCMTEDFSNAQLNLQLAADDWANVLLNGIPIGATSNPGFLSPTSILENDQTRFRPGRNCLTVEVHNTSSVVTGFVLRGSLTASRGRCCDCIEPPRRMAAWWPLDEAAGPTAQELIGNNDGTHVQGPTPVPGKVAGALRFDGVDDYVVAPAASQYDFPTGNFSIDAWIRTTLVDGNPRVIVRTTLDPWNPDPGYHFDVQNGALAFGISDATFHSACNGGFVADGNWHLVAATVVRNSATGMRLYVDGNIVQTCDPTLTASSISNSDQLHIGGYPPALQTPWFQGDIDEVEIFRRALTTAEVQAIYLRGVAGKCKDRCGTDWNLPVCKNKVYVTAQMTVCNGSGVPSSFSWAMQALPFNPPTCTAAGPASFSPPSGTLALAAGACQTVPVIIQRPSGFLPGQTSCFAAQVTNTTTGQSGHCEGSLRAINKWCILSPIDAVDVPTVRSRRTSFEVRNTGDGDPTLGYRLRAIGPDMEPDTQAVSLNGLPPGEPVIDTLTVDPGGADTLRFGTRFVEPDPAGLFTILLEADLDGDGEYEPLSSMTVRNEDHGTNIPAPPQMPACCLEGDLSGDGQAEFAFRPLSTASGYDVVSGDVESLVSGGGFGGTIQTCQADDSPLARVLVPVDQPAGTATWYLARPVNAQGNGTFDENGLGQSSSRDGMAYGCP